MNFNKMVALVMTLVMVVAVFAGCGQNSAQVSADQGASSSESKTSDTSSDKSKEKPQIYLVECMSGGGMFTALESTFIAGCEERGYDYHILCPEEFHNTAQMVQLVDTALTNGADVICGTFNSPADMYREVFDRCKEAGIPIISLSDDAGGQADAWIGVDAPETGRLQAEAAVKYAEGQINMLYMQTEFTREIQNAQYEAVKEEVLRLEPTANVMGQEECKSDSAIAADKMNAFLVAHPEFNTCVALDGNGAIGLVSFCRDQGFADEEFTAVGIDDLPETLRAVRDGVIDCTIVQGFWDMGTELANVASQFIEGKEVTVHTNIMPSIVDGENLEAYCEKWGIDLSSVE